MSLYKLKEESAKNSVDYIIAKLLLNSLYGKFGINPEMDKSNPFTENIKIKNVSIPISTAVTA